VKLADQKTGFKLTCARKHFFVIHGGIRMNNLHLNKFILPAFFISLGKKFCFPQFLFAGKCFADATLGGVCL
jgi:hypothetical protein